MSAMWEKRLTKTAKITFHCKTLGPKHMLKVQPLPAVWRGKGVGEANALGQLNTNQSGVIPMWGRKPRA